MQLSHNSRDDNEELHISVPEEGVDYGADEHDPNVAVLEDFNPDPEELLVALQQGLNIHDGTALLDPATEIPRL